MKKYHLSNAHIFENNDYILMCKKKNSVSMKKLFNNGLACRFFKAMSWYYGNVSNLYDSKYIKYYGWVI